MLVAVEDTGEGLSTWRLAAPAPAAHQPSEGEKGAKHQLPRRTRSRARETERRTVNATQGDAADNRPAQCSDGESAAHTGLLLGRSFSRRFFRKFLYVFFVFFYFVFSVVPYIFSLPFVSTFLRFCNSAFEPFKSEKASESQKSGTH